MSGSLPVRIAAGYLLLIVAAFATLATSDSIGLAVLVTLALAAVLAAALALDASRSARSASESGRDAAERRLASLIATAAQERDRLAAALNSSVDPLLAVDREGRITFANTAAEGLLERAGLIGSSFAFALPDERVIEALRASREDGQRHIALLEQPGRRHLQVITAPIAAGGEWSVLVIVHDLTDVRRTEQVRRDFIANVSHELRTPLASLKSVIETLQDGALEDPSAARDFLARADAEIDRIVEIMEELLELSRIESGEVPMAAEPVDLAAVLSRAVGRLRLQAQREGVDLELEAAPALPPILGDAERLERVALNLVHNALKFTPAGGSVRVRAAVEDGALVVRVSDTGAGIPAGDLPRVFERFYKADRARSGAGTGLGLAIVKHTVEAHGGSVAVESAEGRGATFSFSLPAVRAPAGTQAAAARRGE